MKRKGKIIIKEDGKMGKKWEKEEVKTNRKKVGSSPNNQLGRKTRYWVKA